MKTSMLLLKAACFLSIPTIFMAEDFTTLTAEEYKNVTVVRVEPDGIIIKHSAGIAKLPFSVLPSDVRAKYRYDPVQARSFAEAQQRAAAKTTALAEAVKRALRVRVTVIEVINGGAIASAWVPQEVSKRRVDTYSPFSIARAGDPSNVATKTVTWFETEYKKLADSIFIRGLAAVVEKGTYDCTIYPAGTFTYTPKDGSETTMSQYALTAADAAKAILKPTATSSVEPAGTTIRWRAVSPQDTSKEGGWRIVKSWQGNGDKTTEPFQILAKPWRIRWQVVAAATAAEELVGFSVYVYTPGGTSYVANADSSSSGGGSSFVYEVGEFYLKIVSANCTYILSAEEK